MPAIEGGDGEIIVGWVDFEAIEGIDGGFSPLPDIADEVVKLAVLEMIYRAG